MRGRLGARIIPPSALEKARAADGVKQVDGVVTSISATVLAKDGKVNIVIDVSKDDAKWLRTSSVFTLERSVVGETRIRAFSGVLDDPPLPDGNFKRHLYMRWRAVRPLRCLEICLQFLQFAFGRDLFCAEEVIQLIPEEILDRKSVV